MSDMTVLHQTFDFSGCKIALLYGDTILTILRDDIPTIPYPNMWDFPGSGREKDETPFECIKREVFEELGIELKNVIRDLFILRKFLFSWWPLSVKN